MDGVLEDAVDGAVESGTVKKDANLCVAAEAVAETAGALVEPNTDANGVVFMGLKKEGGSESVETDGGLAALNVVGDANEKGVEALDAAPKPVKPVNLCEVLDCTISVV